MMGKPYVWANTCASCRLEIGESVPGTTGTPKTQGGLCEKRHTANEQSFALKDFFYLFFLLHFTAKLTEDSRALLITEECHEDRYLLMAKKMIDQNYQTVFHSKK